MLIKLIKFPKILFFFVFFFFLLQQCCWCCSVAKSCLSLCDHMDCNTPDFPIPHHLPEFIQVHVHWICGSIQSPHPLYSFSFCLQSFLSSGSFPMSKLFSSCGQSIGASVSASFLPNIQGWFPLRLTDLITLLSKGLRFDSPYFPRAFPSTRVQRHQFFSALPFLLSSSHIVHNY